MPILRICLPTISGVGDGIGSSGVHSARGESGPIIGERGPWGAVVVADAGETTRRVIAVARGGQNNTRGLRGSGVKAGIWGVSEERSFLHQGTRIGHSYRFSHSQFANCLSGGTILFNMSIQRFVNSKLLSESPRIETEFFNPFFHQDTPNT